MLYLIVVFKITTTFLKKFNIVLNDEYLFNEFLLFKTYVKNIKTNDMTVNKLWCDFFIENNCNELKKIVQFYFCLPAHNANVERVFSLIKSQWTPDINKLSPETISDIIRVKYNFDMSCPECYEFLKKTDERILKQIRGIEKYT